MTCLSHRGLLRHVDSAHRPPETPENEDEAEGDHTYYYQHHPDLDGKHIFSYKLLRERY